MIPVSWYLLLSAFLFACGVTGFLIKRNIITLFMSIELMLNGVNLSFVAFAANLGAWTDRSSYSLSWSSPPPKPQLGWLSSSLSIARARRSMSTG